MTDYIKLVNRKHRIPADFVPKDLVEADILFEAMEGDPKRKLEKRAAVKAAALFERAKEQNIFLYGISGYRSYERQRELYEQSKSGYVAEPGTSEHQTGLALDVSAKSVNLELTEEFAETREGQWLKNNAPLFGFILRYPRGKEKITGYQWEPWHIRYVGRPLSLYISLTGQTLEEFLLLKKTHQY